MLDGARTMEGGEKGRGEWWPYTEEEDAYTRDTLYRHKGAEMRALSLDIQDPVITRAACCDWETDTKKPTQWRHSEGVDNPSNPRMLGG